MEQAPELLNLRSEIMDRVQVVIENATEYRVGLDRYGILEDVAECSVS